MIILAPSSEAVVTIQRNGDATIVTIERTPNGAHSPVERENGRSAAVPLLGDWAAPPSTLRTDPPRVLAPARLRTLVSASLFALVCGLTWHWATGSAHDGSSADSASLVRRTVGETIRAPNAATDTPPPAIRQVPPGQPNPGGPNAAFGLD